jgi:acyl dehydratase
MSSSQDKSSPLFEGKEKTFHTSEEVGRAVIKRFAAAIGDSNPLYWDEQYARESPYGGIIAPPTLIFELNYNVGGDIGDDGLDQGLQNWLGFGAGMQRAGNEYEIFQPVRPDDVITLKHRITSVAEKQGKRGKLVFVVTEISYTNQRGELLGINRETIALPES